MPAKKISDKKKSMHDKKTSNLQTKLKKIEKETTQLKQELQEKNDKLLRAYADLQNLQKRMEKEINIKAEETKKKYLSELIDLNEILQKAYTDNNPKEGLKAILNNMERLFEKEQIRIIDCTGKSFDHNYHHAISTVEKNGCNDGEIVDEIKKGYMIKDKLLRPSQVIVAK